MTEVCGYCGFASIHSPECNGMQAMTGTVPRRMTSEERAALERAYWKSVSVVHDGFVSRQRRRKAWRLKSQRRTG